MTVRNLVLHLIGFACACAGALWLYLDVKPDGHVDITTAGGVAALLLTGGFLIDKQTTIDILSFLKSQAQAALGIWRPPPSGGAS